MTIFNLFFEFIIFLHLAFSPSGSTYQPFFWLIQNAMVDNEMFKLMSSISPTQFTANISLEKIDEIREIFDDSNFASSVLSECEFSVDCMSGLMLRFPFYWEIIWFGFFIFFLLCFF